MTKDQFNAAIRHVGTAGATAFTVFAALGTIPQDKAQEIIANIHVITQSLENIFGAASAIFAIVGPALMVVFPKMAATAASLSGQLRSITQNPEVKVEGQIVVPPPVAKDVPSTKVVPKE